MNFQKSILATATCAALGVAGSVQAGNLGEFWAGDQTGGVLHIFNQADPVKGNTFNIYINEKGGRTAPPSFTQVHEPGGNSVNIDLVWAKFDSHVSS